MEETEIKSHHTWRALRQGLRTGSGLEKQNGVRHGVDKERGRNDGASIGITLGAAKTKVPRPR